MHTLLHGVVSRGDIPDAARINPNVIQTVSLRLLTSILDLLVSSHVVRSQWIVLKRNFFFNSGVRQDRIFGKLRPSPKCSSIFIEWTLMSLMMIVVPL